MSVENIGSRLNKALESIYGDKNNKEIASKYKITTQFIGQLKKKKAINETISFICEQEMINLNWIQTGKGEMFLKDEKVSNSNLIEITYFKDSYAAAGAGALNYDTAPVAMAFDVEFLKTQLGITTFKHIHIIKAIGNSMYPTINTGELLFINPFENENFHIRDKDIYIINTPNGTLVKRIKIHPTKSIYTLVSDNIEDEDIVLEGDEFESCSIIGRVVGHFSGL